MVAVLRSSSETLRWLWSKCILQGFCINWISVLTVIVVEFINAQRVYKIDF